MIDLCEESRPEVSVIMPVLNPHPRYFREAVQSIVRQTFRRWELIIIEDFSPRDGREILSGIDDPRIHHHVNLRRTGLIRQRNRALAEARADLVAVLDADDIAEPSRLEKQVAYLSGHPETGVVGSQIGVIDDAGALVGHRRFPLESESILQSLKRVVPLSHTSVMYRKALVLEAGGYGSHEFPHVDDYELWCRLASRGVRFANLPEVLARYRIHPEMGKVTQLREVIRGILSVKHRYWGHQFDMRSQARAWGERCLLWLPKPVVFSVLTLALYRDRLPGIRDGNHDGETRVREGGKAECNGRVLPVHEYR